MSKMSRGIHGRKIEILKDKEQIKSSKGGSQSVNDALDEYDKWIRSLNSIDADSGTEYIEKAVNLLTNYKYYIDYDFLFNQPIDFLYRQKGQLKIDNTIMEEFLPYMIKEALIKDNVSLDKIDIASQTATFSSLRFEDTIRSDNSGFGMKIKTKDQDFAISKNLFMKTSQTDDFNSFQKYTLQLGYVMGEMKTNLDKTMFQEASATAKDLKQTVPNARYYVLAEFLDMTPISTVTTDIDGVFVLRKSKRQSSDKRKNYANWNGRSQNKDEYNYFLNNNPFDKDLFIRFYEIVASIFEENLKTEQDILKDGYF